MGIYIFIIVASRGQQLNFGKSVLMRDIFFSELLLITSQIDYLKYNYINKILIYKNDFKNMPEVLIGKYL